MPRLPQRIVCLTTETVEVLYALGESERIAGISGYTVRPPQARKEKPKVYAFTTGDIEKILAVQPDLVLTFSDLQADIARDLIKAGVPVYAFNTRSVDDILGMVETLGRLVGAEEKAAALVSRTGRANRRRPRHRRRTHRQSGHRPRVYFEEWDAPNITAVRWASELIEIAGGANIFPERALSPLARDRILADPLEVVRRDPEIIIGSWCGKHFRPEHIAARPGWSTVSAVQSGRMHEIKSAIILTPGPVAISEGLPLLLDIFDL
jgi:iron complex transport system substrate-binding protein